jgi:hypothetical protein
MVKGGELDTFAPCFLLLATTNYSLNPLLIWDHLRGKTKPTSYVKDISYSSCEKAHVIKESNHPSHNPGVIRSSVIWKN